MKFTETKLSGAYIIELEPLTDERGFFARTFCRQEFAALGLVTEFVQCNIAFNLRRGTLRGMHYQEEPYSETKLIRCTRGALYDVIVDLRSESDTYCQWIGVELTPDNGKMLYVPIGFAQGCQALTDNTEVFYQMSEFYHPERAKGVCWNDPRLQIEWPIQDPIVLSDRDRNWSIMI